MFWINICIPMNNNVQSCCPQGPTMLGEVTNRRFEAGKSSTTYKRDAHQE